jgi:hypothetical protein
MTRYGAWPSPISAASIVVGAATINEVVVDGDDIWWAEVRPSEGGRAPCAGADGTVASHPQNQRGCASEYGGGGGGCATAWSYGGSPTGSSGG